MEAVRILGHRDACSVADAVENLKGTIEIIVKNLFGPCEKRWTETYFPFTEPSFELEIFFDGKWVEMLGCGIIHDRVLARSGR